MGSVARPRATVYTERNEGIQIGEHHESTSCKHVTNQNVQVGEHHEHIGVKHEYNYHQEAAPGVDAYFRGLGVDPEDSRTKVLGSAGDKPIKSCWDRILARPEFTAWQKTEDSSILWVPDGGKVFVGYFFCRDMDSTMNTAISILKGLIYGLGQEDRALMQFLSDNFKSPDDINGTGIDALWGILARMLSYSASLGSIYLVVDALDECREEREVQTFLNFVRKASFRRPVKWVFTSRQSPQLRRSLSSGMGVYTIDLDTSKEVAESVDKYLDLVVGANQQFLVPQRQQILDFLRSNAEKTFLYVSLVLEDLRMAADVDISKRLSDLKNNVHGESVYRPYRLMIQRVLKRDEDEGTTMLQDLLKAVLLATQALSIPELAIAAGLPPEFYCTNSESIGHRRTVELVQKCGHILRFTEDKVYLVHQSAKDYLTTGDEGDERPFLSHSSPREHARLAERGLQALGPELLPIPDLSTWDSLTDTSPSQKFLQTMKSLRYIYCHWTHHIVEAQGKFTDWALVERFLETGLLAWVEIMGHLDQIQRCVDMVQELRAAISSEGESAIASQRIKALLDDAFQFLVRYRLIIQAHPRQVYFLAKYFTPKSSPTRKNYEHIPCCLSIGNDPPVDWDPCQFTLHVSGHQWGDKDQRKVTAPRYDRSGFNLTDGKGYFSFTSRDFRVSFSADSRTISVGSCTLGRNVLRWNVGDGSFAGSFDATEDGIAHSDDGRLIASWSDKGLGVWEVETRNLICRLENSPSDCQFTAVRIARDGSAIAVAFDEFSMFRKTKRRLKLWDAREGSFLQEINVAGDTPIRDVNFTRDGRTLLVYIGRTLLLHDMRTYKTHQVPLEDILEPNGVAFSDGGSILVVVTRSLVAFYRVDPLSELARWSVPRDNNGLDAYFYQEQWLTRAKPNFGIEVAISEDAKTPALSFRDSIAFFRLEERPLRPTYHTTTKYRTPIEDTDFFQSKLPVIDSIRFSPCGRYPACARNDDAISIWDVRASCRTQPSQPSTPNGLVLPYPFFGCWDGFVSIPIYSPDGKVCGTRSADHVELWEVATASIKLQFKGTSSLGSCDIYDYIVNRFAWSFSPDSKFAVTVVTRRIYIVNTYDWSHVERTLPGYIATMAFNSQSTHLALATSTSPPLVLLFDTASGKCILHYGADCEGIQAITFASSGTLMAGGAASKTFIYYVWEKSDHSGAGSPRDPLRIKTPRTDMRALGMGFMKILRMEFLQDNFTAVSII
ncbi:uncharacterized protein DNG_09493 [Cephalotrichum gorgonifer]|uniref:Nephrocystin 3-like N-terminal domain-containing protein n=1 Tax=Cephalotrichum gorgonifer TaxID=2041049 RepID=A0AAE8N7D6_9PEZI|nr:uncharacterized protein DNG_09493 [Cephalotrichum gorgonifer]